MIFPHVLRSTIGVVAVGSRRYIDWMDVLHRSVLILRQPFSGPENIANEDVIAMLRFLGGHSLYGLRGTHLSTISKSRMRVTEAKA